MSVTSSKKVKQKRWRRKRAHLRIRNRVAGTGERPRLAVFKSLKHIYAQVIDDERGATVAHASTLDAEVRDKLAASTTATGGRAAARLVGETIARRAKAKGVEAVIFDRGGYIYHGKVREVAEGARETGLKF